MAEAATVTETKILEIPQLGEKLHAAMHVIEHCFAVEMAICGDDLARDGETKNGLTQLEAEAKDAALRLFTRVFDAEQPQEVE